MRIRILLLAALAVAALAAAFTAGRLIPTQTLKADATAIQRPPDEAQHPGGRAVTHPKGEATEIDHLLAEIERQLKPIPIDNFIAHQARREALKKQIMALRARAILLLGRRDEMNQKLDILKTALEELPGHFRGLSGWYTRMAVEAEGGPLARQYEQMAELALRQAQLLDAHDDLATDAFNRYTSKLAAVERQLVFLAALERFLTAADRTQPGSDIQRFCDDLDAFSQQYEATCRDFRLFT